MTPITRLNVAAVITELTAQGWQRSCKRKRPPFEFIHHHHARLAAIAQQLPTGKGQATFRPHW
ncbi:hypothetical protein HNR62_001067 [Oceanisphaera litoralis]|uniref:hypothetical protein n=1 Tax=Oceanisphaera litoralis TaxID=225144 RepID=UPI00195EA543|nr:hypothetical protein [Oceanisphaera litoralis]MBM7455207.1 hypothetical protein [Oceanisphaera litoralis]